MPSKIYIKTNECKNCTREKLCVCGKPLNPSGKYCSECASYTEKIGIITKTGHYLYKLSFILPEERKLEQRIATYHETDINYPWICPNCGRRYELEADIDDCPCWRT